MSERLHVIAVWVVLVMLMAVSMSEAANCGDGIKACTCGDTVVANHTLANNLTCAGTALNIGDNAGLNLNGKTLQGNHAGDDYGLNMNGTTNANIYSTGSQAQIIGFKIGIRLTGSSSGNTIQGITTNNNTAYGVQVCGSANTVHSMVVQVNGDEGVHFCTGATGNALHSNHGISGNATEQVYLLGSTGNTIANNRIDGNTPLYVKDSHDNTISGNVLIGPSPQIFGESTGNWIYRNQFQNRLLLRKESASKAPHNNLIEENEFYFAPGNCLELDNAWDNDVRGNWFYQCNRAIRGINTLFGFNIQAFVQGNYNPWPNQLDPDFVLTPY